MSALTEDRIPTSNVLIYSAPAFGVFMSGTLVSMYLLKFSTDVLLMAPAVVGTILLLARVWDAVTDPATGWLSDRTKTRFGRRRPWMFGSALPLGLSVVMLWSPPETLNGTALTIWVCIAVILFYTTYTTFRVPHIALGAELSRGYHDRTRVFGILQSVEIVGMLATAGLVIVLEQSEDPRMIARSLAVAIAITTAIIILLSVWRLKERAEFQGRGEENPWRAFSDVIKNTHARILVGAIFLEMLGFMTLVALLPYLSDYVVNSPGSTGIYLFASMTSALVSIPFWMWLARRIGKIRAWTYSLSAKAISFAALFTIGEGDFERAVIQSAIFGLAHGCGPVIGASLKADIVDSDEAVTGQRKEATFFAAWTFAEKLATGLAAWCVGLMLSAVAFVPNAVQTPQTIFAISATISALPAVAHIFAIFALSKFKLDESAHRKARQQAEEESPSAA